MSMTSKLSTLRSVKMPITAISHSMYQWSSAQLLTCCHALLCWMLWGGLASLHGNGLSLPPHHSAVMHPVSSTTGATATCRAKRSGSKDRQGTVD